MLLLLISDIVSAARADDMPKGHRCVADDCGGSVRKVRRGAWVVSVTTGETPAKVTVAIRHGEFYA